MIYEGKTWKIPVFVLLKMYPAVSKICKLERAAQQDIKALINTQVRSEKCSRFLQGFCRMTTVKDRLHIIWAFIFDRN